MFELTVAIVLLVISVGLVLSFFQVANDLALTARNKTVAMNDARAALEQAKATSSANLGTVQWNNFISGNLNNEQINVTTSTVSGLSGLRQINCRLSWAETGNRQRSLQLATLKSKDLS